jgi:hypothetical protein
MILHGLHMASRYPLGTTTLVETKRLAHRSRPRGWLFPFLGNREIARFIWTPCSSDWYAHTLLLRLLFKVEDVFDITGRGCVLAPVVPDGLDFKIRAEDRIQLRTPFGRLFDTHIASIELLKMRNGPCRMAIMLPRDFTKNDVPVGTEIWHISEG